MISESNCIYSHYITFENYPITTTATAQADVFTYDTVLSCVDTLIRNNVLPDDDGYYVAYIHPAYDQQMEELAACRRMYEARKRSRELARQPDPWPRRPVMVLRNRPVEQHTHAQRCPDRRERRSLMVRVRRVLR